MYLSTCLVITECAEWDVLSDWLLSKYTYEV